MSGRRTGAAATPLLLSYELGDRVYGGLGRHVTALALAMAERGAEVHVATLGRDDHEHDLRGVTVHPTPAIPRVGQGADWLASLLAFDTVLPVAAARALDRATVVHAHDWLVARTAMALSRDLPLVVTVHATERGRHQGWLPDATSRFVDTTERWLAAAAAQVIVCSTALRDVVVDWGVAANRVTVIPNAVHGGVLPRAPEPGRILFAGRLEHEKGGQVLLQALRRLRADCPNAHAVFAGTGSQRAMWQRRADELGVANLVSFVGHLDWPELAVEYARAAVVAVPSLYEPFGMVAAEAMAAAVPLVATAVDGLQETVGNGGALVPAEDDVALAAALGHLLSSHSAYAAAEAAAQRRAAQLLTWAEVADRTMAVYAKAMDRSAVWTG